MKHGQHILRAAFIVIVVAGGYIAGRPTVVPDSFGDKGYYRHDSAGEYMKQPVIHTGSESCEECHIDQFEIHLDGKHKTLSCESCHGPGTLHADKDDKIADAVVNKHHDLCMTCHLKLPARPADMPQVEFRPHLDTAGFKAKGKKIPEDVCLPCHDPHEANK